MMKYVCYLVSERNLLDGKVKNDVEFHQKRDVSFLSKAEDIAWAHAVIFDPDFLLKRKEEVKRLLKDVLAYETRPVLLGLIGSFSDVEPMSGLPLDGLVSLEELSSPFFRGRLRTFFELFELRERIEWLEMRNRDFLLTLVSVLGMQIPGIKERRDLSLEMAEYMSEVFRLNPSEKNELILALTLREIGKIGLEKKNLSFENLREYRTHCLIGRELLLGIESMRSVANLIGSQYERFDGQGFPSGLRGDQMSTSSLILQGITFVIELRELGLPSEEIASRVRSEAMKALDPYVSNYLAQYLEVRRIEENGKTLVLSLEELKPGMVLAQDLYSVSGKKILPKEAEITEHVLEIIEKRKDVDPVIGCVRVYAKRV